MKNKFIKIYILAIAFMIAASCSKSSNSNECVQDFLERILSKKNSKSNDFTNFSKFSSFRLEITTVAPNFVMF